MDNIYHNLTSFLAIWFRNLQKSTYNVNVINKEADKVSPLLYEKLQAIHFLLQGLEGKELKVKVSNQKELNTKDLEDKLSALLSGVNSIELDNSTVERLLSDLISLSKGVKKVEVLNQPEMPSKMDIVGKVEVSNLPKVQEVTGDFNLKESKDILNSLKELASEIRDLKLESIQGYKSIGQTFVGSTGSREAHKLTDGTKTATITTSGANNALDVNIVAGGAGNGAILDGVDSDIKATVKDLTNSNPLTVALVDGSGDHITSIGGGTQYTEGDTDATIVGTAIMWKDAGNALTPVSSSKPLPVSASIDPTGLATSAKQDTIIGHVDGIETLLGTIDADTSNISTKIDTIVGHVDGLETLIGTTNTTLTTIDGRVDGIEGLLTTIDGDTGNIVTSVQLLDDTVATDGSATPTKGILMAGQDGTNAQTVKTDSDGNLQVDVLTMPTTTITGTVDLGATDNAVLDTIAAKDFATQTTLAAINAKLVTGTDIGDVTINNAGGAAAVNIQDGGNTITVDGTVAVTNSDITSVKTATELLDDTVFVDDADWTADTSKHLLVGGVTQVATTANTDGDVTPLTTNAFRELRTAIPESDLATAGTSHVKKYYTNAGAVTDGIVWSPAAGKRWYVTDLIINVSAAATVTFEDDKAGGDEAVMKFELAANSGVSHTFNTPWFSGEDAADLIVTTTAGNVYICLTGYEL